MGCGTRGLGSWGLGLGSRSLELGALDLGSRSQLLATLDLGGGTRGLDLGSRSFAPTPMDPRPLITGAIP